MTFTESSFGVIGAVALVVIALLVAIVIHIKAAIIAAGVVILIALFLFTFKS